MCLATLANFAIRFSCFGERISADRVEFPPIYLGMEEDLGSEEALVADVDAERLFGDGVEALVPLHPLGRLLVVLGKLFRDVRTDVAVPLLHRLSKHTHTHTHLGKHSICQTRRPKARC